MSHRNLVERLRAAQLRGNTAPAELCLLQETADWIERFREELLDLADSWCDESGTSVAYTKLKCARKLRALVEQSHE